MSKFITLNNKIINKELIKIIEVERNVEKTDDYDYPDGLRTTDIFVKIKSSEFEEEFKILDEDFLNYVNFIGEFYELEFNEARKKAISIMENAPIRKLT